MTDYKTLLDAMIKGKPPVARPDALESNTDLWYEYSHFPYGKGNVNENLPTDFTISPTTLIIESGDSSTHNQKINVTFSPSGSLPLEFTSSDTCWINVDNNGNVSFNPLAVCNDNPGTATITVYCEQLNITKTVDVYIHWAME